MAMIESILHDSVPATRKISANGINFSIDSIRKMIIILNENYKLEVEKN